MELNVSLLPTQSRFTSCKDPFPAYIAGYGAGKTWVNCYHSIKHSILFNPGLTGLLIAPTYRDLRDTNIPMFEMQLELFGIPYTIHKTNFVLSLPWWNSRILLRSADEPDKLKGPNVAWAGIDEVARIDEKIWGVAVSRVRSPEATLKQTFATGTPEGLNWVYERWVESSSSGYTFFQTTTAENIHLDSTYIDALKSSHDEEELKQKLYGEFSEGAKGRAYKPFDRRLHLSENSVLDQENKQKIIPQLPLIVTCDFNIDPCAWIILQHFKGGIYVADEIVLNDTSTPEMIDEFKARGYQHHSSGIVVYGDPAGKSRSTIAARSDYALMREHGFRRLNIASAAPAVKDRVQAVNNKLKDGNGRIHLYIHPECKILIRDLERVKWKQGSPGTLDKSDPDLTHASDALGYFIHREYAITRTYPRRTKVADALKKRKIS